MAESTMKRPPDTRCKPGLRKTSTNPLQAGIMKFLSSVSGSQAVQPEQNDVPKRYTRYGSLLLLGPTFTHHSPAWRDMYVSLTEDAKREMFTQILQCFPGGAVTHVAMNAPISQHTELGLADENLETRQNVMRSPTGLLPLYGDFGPPDLAHKDTALSHFDSANPQPHGIDLDNAYWTETNQLHDITQVWAPRWTMFSRGNISEKARILQDGTNKSIFPGLTEDELQYHLRDVDVVDFYIGIGYFAFCYLSRGVKRVWGWDINGWSIEGLRRGCIKNGWGVKVVRVDHDGNIIEPAGVEPLLDEIDRVESTEQAIRCVAFWGDNKWAGKVANEISLALESRGKEGLNVRHCNLGLLPTSRSSWDGALEAIHAYKGGWLHIHENVNVEEIDSKQAQIVLDLQKIVSTRRDQSWMLTCDHIERVKTYAPGVMHCVYDINVYPPS